MDKDTLEILIIIGGFAITTMIFLLRFPTKDDMKELKQDIRELRKDIRNIYHILIQGKPNKEE